MEQARLFIAIALSLLVFLLWQVFFVEKQPVQPPPQAPQQEKAASEAPYTPESKAATPAPTASIKPEDAQRTAKTITVNTPLYVVEISENGGVFTSFLLHNFREEANQDSPLKQLISLPNGTLKLGLSRQTLPHLSKAVFVSDAATESINVSEGPRSLTFRWKSPQGIVVERRYSFSPETYLIKHKITVKNGSNVTLADNWTLSLLDAMPDQSARFGFEGPSALINDEAEQIKIKDIQEKNTFTGTIGWISLQTRYFISSVIPSSPDNASLRLSIDPGNVIQAKYVQPETAIQPGTQQAFDYELYFGPKSVSTLKSVGGGLDKAVNFGWFDFLAKPCLWLMNFFYGIIPNYGVAIIILTVLMKILLWPLGVKSYKSMNEMKKLQPIMAEIREKHKGDKKKMNEEIMGLYKTYKINPMGGCLPMIAQIPVFFALYRMLYEAIELRHAPFFGWITDLSAPDRLFHFSFSIPFMQPPYGIPVLTLVMGGTMLLQQKMTPSPGDPAQAKMMMLMPVVFTFIFINFSSGLVLYWLVNNVLSISQQYYITKKFS